MSIYERSWDTAAFCIFGMCQNCHLSERFEKESFAILGNVKTKKAFW